MTEDKKPSSEKKQDLELNALVEAILFVSPEPLSADQIANLLETTPRLVKKALEEIDALYEKRGIRLQYHKKKIQILMLPLQY